MASAKQNISFANHQSATQIIDKLINQGEWLCVEEE